MSGRLLTASLLTAVCAGIGLGCGPAVSEVTPLAPPPAPTFASGASGSGAERWFPLVDGHIYQYEMHNDQGSAGVLTARAKRVTATAGSLQMGGKDKQFQYVEDGVQQLKNGAVVYILKLPLSVGNRWRGYAGSLVEISAVGLALDLPAGPQRDCVKTLERRGGDRPLQVATSYCPDVGIVELEAAAGGQLERAVLRSYGPPVDIGPDSVRRVP